MFIACSTLALGLSSCAGAEVCPAPQIRGEWSSKCFATDKSGQRTVRSEYAKNLKLNRQGIALITISQPRELLAVDRKGKVVIPGIRHSGDFDFPHASGGLGRFDTPSSNLSAGGAPKCGYFDSRTFKITVPAKFDQCEPFNHEAAEVCLNCTKYCTERDCQNSVNLGGKGLTIDRYGKVLRERNMPTLESACHGQGLARVEKMVGPFAVLQCGANDAEH